MMPVGDRLQGWFPLTGLPWNLPAVLCIFADPNQPLQAPIPKLIN